MNEAKKLNLLYIGNSLFKHGYTPTSIDTLSPQLSEFYNVTSVSDKKNPVLRLLDMLKSVVKLRKTTDVILIDTYSTKNFYYALLVSQLARLFKINYYTYLHGGGLPERLDKTPFLANLIFNHSVINIAPSQYMKAAFSKYNYKVTFIPNNIDISLYPKIERSKLKPNILYVRSFSSVYNPQLAIQAFSKFKQEYPDAKMCMVGPDKDGTLDICKSLAKELGTEMSIDFPGKLSKKEWVELSKDYDIFINPTNFDNQPVSVIEAMALGFPIVSTKVGGLPFLIEDGEDGLLFEPKNVEAMYEKMNTLMKHPELAEKLSRNARLKAESFDWNTVQRQWITTLKTL